MSWRVNTVKPGSMGIADCPACFVPLFIGSSHEATRLLEGHIRLLPRADDDLYDDIVESLPVDYDRGMDIKAQIEHGFMVSTAEMHAVGCSLYPLVFEDGNFQPLNDRYQELGDTALLILQPDVFLARIRRNLSGQTPHLYEAYVATPLYVESIPRNGAYSARMACCTDAWKREHLLLAEIRQDAAMSDFRYPEPLELELGSLHDIAVIVRVERLVSGDIPDVLQSPVFRDYVASFAHPSRGVTGHRISFMANVMPIVPTEEWLNRLSGIFASDEWSASAFSERLRPDGASTARLSFRSLGHEASVSIGINHVDFEFADYGTREERALAGLLDVVCSELGSRCCSLAIELSADLGMRGHRYAGYLQLDEQFIVERDGVVIEHAIASDSLYGTNIYGEAAHKPSWRYTMRAHTPDIEKTLWYNVEETMRFFSHWNSICKQQAHELMQANDPYEQFQRIKRDVIMDG